jgi:hypothetical protein
VIDTSGDASAVRDAVAAEFDAALVAHRQAQ